MNARTKLRWVDIPRQSLREGLACGQGGVQVMLLMGDDRRSVLRPAATTTPRIAQTDARPTEKPH
jgi:hypothetical protein